LIVWKPQNQMSKSRMHAGKFVGRGVFKTQRALEVREVTTIPG